MVAIDWSPVMHYDTTPGLAEFQASWPFYWMTKSWFDFTLPTYAHFCFFSIVAVPENRFYGWGSAMPNRLSQSTGSVPGQTGIVGTVSGTLSRETAVSPEAQLQAYPSGVSTSTLATPAVPNTEQFLDWVQARKPIQNIKDLSISGENGDVGLLLICTNDGRLFSQGRLIGQGTHTSEIGLPSNLFATRSSNSLQPVYNTDPNFFDQTFIRVGATQTSGPLSGTFAGIALSADNELWMAGDTSVFAETTDFSNGVVQQPYYALRTVDKWYSSGAVLQTNTPIFFANFWVSGSRMLALTTEGKLYMVGNDIRLGKTISSPIFHEVGGFLDSVTLTSGGSGYTSNPTVSASAPDDPYGVEPTFEVFRDVNNPDVVETIRILDPGWGYTSAPTLTFTGGGGSGATATCEIFDDTWKSANLRGDSFAAISSDGNLYTWGRGLSALESGFVNRLGPVRAHSLHGPQPGEYAKVAVMGASFFSATLTYRFGAAIDVNGKVSIWGLEGITPDGERHDKLTLLSTLVPALSDYTFVDAVCVTRGVALLADDGSVWTYGRCHESLGHGAASLTAEKTVNNSALASGTYSGRKIHKVVGENVWTHISSNEFIEGYVAVRQPEEFDPFGIRQDPIPPFSA